MRKDGVRRSIFSYYLTAMADRSNVVISSTVRDLPNHRREVMDACIRQGMFPSMMEHLPASDADAIRISLDLVDNADIYVGIFVRRKFDI
jgi:hypothetical protein